MIQGEIWRALLPVGDEGTCRILGRLTAPSEDVALKKAQQLWPKHKDELKVELVLS